ncbi:MAG: imidazolonepropionase [Proteobacteria bacterium]|nr:imidazolonepropionase [Pseudomonadota bacterium]MDA0994277.1 imidazolonepropionase [Pseudomonadota bacterium]
MLRFFAIHGGATCLPDWDLILTELNVATMVEDCGPYGVIENAAVAIANGRISWIGARADLPAGSATESRSMGGRWLTPALIDCHTHLVFAGNRSAEFEQRLAGASYEEIARAGGGIMSTVNATRAASADLLLEQTAARLDILRAEGCATVEIKSGYGLNLQTELKLLETIRALKNQAGISISSTFLGAHAIPVEFRGKADEYIDLVCDEMLPAVHEKQLADAVDAYCESIAFSVKQIGRVFETARSLGLPVKLHADQLSDCGGAELAAEFGALSADHLEYTSAKGVDALAAAGSVAVLLPGAFLTLGETECPPVALLRDRNVPIAIATDCNPGTSPICSLRTTMALATSLFRLTPAECLAGVTRNAAVALGLEQDRGTLETGKRADIAIWDIGHPQELSYWIGKNDLAELLVAGRTA